MRTFDPFTQRQVGTMMSELITIFFVEAFFVKETFYLTFTWRGQHQELFLAL